MKHLIKYLAAILITLTWVTYPDGGIGRGLEWQKDCCERVEQKRPEQEKTSVKPVKSLPKMQFFYKQEKLVR